MASVYSSLSMIELGFDLDLMESLFNFKPTLDFSSVSPPETYVLLNNIEAATLPFHLALPKSYTVLLGTAQVL